MLILKDSVYPKIGAKRDHLAPKIVALVDEAKSFRDGLYRGNGLDFKLRSDYRFYKGWDDDSLKSTKVRHTTRLIYRMVRVAFSDIYKGEIQPKIEAQMEESQEQARIANLVLKEQSQLARSSKAWAIFTREKLIFGTAIMRKEWFKKEIKHLDRKKKYDAFGLPFMEEEERDDVLYEGPKNFNVSLNSFFWDPSGIDMESCNWVAEEDHDFSLFDMVKFMDDGTFDISDKTKKDIMQSYGFGAYRNDEYRDDYTTVPANQGITPKFKVTRYFTDEEVFYVLNDTVLLNESKESQVNPFKIRHSHRKPYIHSTLFETGEFLGEGLSEIAGSYQFYSSTAIQLLIEQMYEMRRRFLVEKGAIEDPSVVNDVTNGLILCNDLMGVKMLDGVSATGDALGLKSELEADAETDTGITRTKLGDRIGGNTTATESSGIQKELEKQSESMATNQLSAAREDTYMNCEYNRIFLDAARIKYKGQDTQIDGTIFDLEDITIDVVPESFLESYDTLLQKRIEILQQRLAGKEWAKLKELDKESVRAAGFEPSRFIYEDDQMKPPNPAEEQLRADQQTAEAPAPAQQGENPMPDPGVAPSGPAAANGPAPPTGVMSSALQGLNPQGMGGAPNVALGQTQREAVLGQ